MLQELPQGRVVQVTEDPPRTCEACGTIVELSPYAINAMIGIGSPGHPAMRAFRCPFEEHWSCSPDCWLKVTQACAKEHMYVILKRLHDEYSQNVV
jgi:hypothetical protein